MVYWYTSRFKHAYIKRSCISFSENDGDSLLNLKKQLASLFNEVISRRRSAWTNMQILSLMSEIVLWKSKIQKKKIILQTQNRKRVEWEYAVRSNERFSTELESISVVLFLLEYTVYGWINS